MAVAVATAADVEAVVDMVAVRILATKFTA